jgi:hypothetical protein
LAGTNSSSLSSLLGNNNKKHRIIQIEAKEDLIRVFKNLPMHSLPRSEEGYRE